MITITELAKSKVLEFMESEEQEGLALRISINGRGPTGWNTELHFVGPEEKTDDDMVVDAGKFKVYIDPDSAKNLEGSTVDFVDGLHQSGFKVENPNSVWADPTAKAVQEVIETKINPGVAAHGGWVTLLDVQGDTAYIQLGGGCQGCGMVDVTLKQGIEVALKERVPEIREVVDTTDHANGTNPFYRGAGGQSPVA